MDSTVTNITDSEARRQEKLRRRQERDGQRRAEEIAEQREEMELVGNYVLPRRNTLARIRTELIINAGKHQRLPRRDTHAWIRTELITNMHARESALS